jgi:hypothetical protein
MACWWSPFGLALCRHHRFALHVVCEPIGIGAQLVLCFKNRPKVLADAPFHLVPVANAPMLATDVQKAVAVQAVGTPTEIWDVVVGLDHCNGLLHACPASGRRGAAQP